MSTKNLTEMACEAAGYYGVTSPQVESRYLLSLVFAGEISQNLIARLLEHPLSELAQKTPEELTDLGMDPTNAFRLSAALELGKRCFLEPEKQKAKVHDPIDAYNLFCEMKQLEQERFRVAFVNTKNMVLGIEEISIGTVSASVVDVRMIFKTAIRRNAVNIIIAHNHPSGEPTPSAEDLNITSRIKDAGNLLGVNVLDHLIIGNPGWVSMKKEGYLQ